MSQFFVHAAVEVGTCGLPATALVAFMVFGFLEQVQKKKSKGDKKCQVKKLWGGRAGHFP